MGIRTFTAKDVDAAVVVAALEARGYAVGAAEAVERTLLDTFDGRVHAAGLRIELERASRLTLIVSGTAVVPVRADVDAVPRFVTDLPAGPLRNRLVGIIDVRALLPRVAVRARRRAVVHRDGTGRVGVEAALYDHIAGEGDGELPSWAVEVTELAGYPKPAAALIALLVEHGMTLRDHDTLDAAFAAAGISRTGFDSSPTIPLDPGVAAVDGYAAVLEHLAAAVSANWSGTVDDIDPEFLHDFRVAVRRTRSVLSQGRNVMPTDVRDRLRAEFKWLGDATGPARDLDVYVLEWPRYVAPLGEQAGALEPVRAELEKRRRTAHAALAKALRSKRAARILPASRRWLRSPHDAGPETDAQRPLSEVVVDRITRAQKQVLERGRSITPETPGEVLHELRKDAKKLRYLLECFGGILPPAPRKAFVGRLKALQDNLGRHQDNEVHIDQLHDLAKDLQQRGVSAETLLTMGQLAQHLDQRRQESREEFAQRFAAYDSKATRKALRDVLDAARP